VERKKKKKNWCAQPRTRRVASTLIVTVTGSGPVSVKSETPSKLSMPSPPPGKHAWCVLFHLPFATQFPLTRQIYQHENKARPPDEQSLSIRLYTLLYPFFSFPGTFILRSTSTVTYNAPSSPIGFDYFDRSTARPDQTYDHT
jgi:hypothetical protein